MYNRKTYIDISLLNLDNDYDMINFRNLILSINKKVIKHISQKYDATSFKNNKKFSKLKFSKLKFKNSLKKSIDIFPERLRLTFYNNILVFNENKKLISSDMIQSKTYTKLLISPQFIWLNSKTFGINWTILQAKLYQNIILDEYSFIDDDYNEKYEKYIKMVKMGIPKDGVKQRLKLDNLDSDILDELLNKLNKLDKLDNFSSDKKYNKNTNKLLNVYNCDSQHTPKNITSSMILAVKLNSVSPPKKIPEKSNKHLNPLISLDEIKLKLKNLNKI